MNQKLIVIKIGSNVIFGDSSKIDFDVLENIVDQICVLRAAGYSMIIVTSGAVAAGRELFADDINYSSSFLAAVGQARLLNYYHLFFKERGLTIGQVLLSSDDFLDRGRYQFIHETLSELLARGVVPIINENDVVTHTDWSFGENDFLAAMTAINLSASAVVFLTNVAGVYNKDPREDRSTLLKEIATDSNLRVSACRSVSVLGRGGMGSKIKAAQVAASAGIDAYIINGLVTNNLISLLIDQKEIGTRFQASNARLTQKRGWLFMGKLKSGKIIIDDGAVTAIRNGGSLLAVGIRRVKGKFSPQDIVSIIDLKNQAIGYGLVGYDSKELRLLKDFRPDRVRKHYQKEVIHRNNLTILK